MTFVIGVNRTGKDPYNYEYSGNSLLVDYLGDTLSELKTNEVGIIKGTLIKTEQNNIRKKLGFLQNKDTFKIDFSK